MNGLSVIIPIYNVENYIGECLESVFNSIKQLTNIQVILVDDGSKDGSSDIAKQFAEKHQKNFLYVRKENGGLSDARNFGLRHAKFNYVSFIDSDDYVAENYFLEIFKAMRNLPDMIIFDWIDIVKNNEEKSVRGMENPKALWTVQSSTWNKVYKTKLFNKVKFPKGKSFEDVGTTYKLLYYVDIFVYIPKGLYVYRKSRVGSILSTLSDKSNDIYEMLDETYHFYKKRNVLTKENNEGLSYQYIKLLMWSNMYRTLKYYKLDIFNFYKRMKFTRNIIYSKFPNWKSNYLLLNNKKYFVKRFGSDYINQIDSLGRSLLSTIITITILIVKNIFRK